MHCTQLTYITYTYVYNIGEKLVITYLDYNCTSIDFFWTSQPLKIEIAPTTLSHFLFFLILHKSTFSSFVPFSFFVIFVFIFVLSILFRSFLFYTSFFSLQTTHPIQVSLNNICLTESCSKHNAINDLRISKHMEQEEINRETDEMDDHIEDTVDHTMEKNGRIKNIYTRKGVEEVVTKVLDDKNKPIPRRRTKMMDDITTGDTNVTDNSDNEAIEAVDSDGNELNKNKRRIKTTTKVTDSKGNEVLGSGSELNEDLNESELDELEQLIELMGVKNERIEELEMALQESVKMMTEKEKDLGEEEERRRAIMEKVRIDIDNTISMKKKNNALKKNLGRHQNNCI